MTKGKDLDDIAAIEKAIAKKYGKVAVKNPKSGWDDEKEAEYLEQQKKLAEKLNSVSEDDDRVELDGVFVSKKLLNKKRTSRVCSYCETYSFKMVDDLYMRKFDSCFECYIQYIEGREWKIKEVKGAE